MTGPLTTWRDGAAKEAISRAGGEGQDGVPVEERVATFDNDGALWCEKPVPIQADFILRRLAEMAEGDPELRERQPWKGAYEGDHAWLGQAIVEHYAGDDSKVRILIGGVIAAHSGMSVDEYEAVADSFLRTTQHPTLGRGYLQCAYAPMVELLGYLKANGFSNYIASGGGRDFMRPISEELYGIPRDRVIGSSTALEYSSADSGGTITRKAEADFVDDGPQKPIRIWSRVGRRPILAGGNANGDIPMLDFTHTPTNPPCASSCSTMMPSGSSTTRREPNRHWSRPRRTAGPSSASRTTGARSSDLGDCRGSRTSIRVRLPRRAKITSYG